MRKWKMTVVGLLFGVCGLVGGCVDGWGEGLNDGVSSGVSAIVEALLISAADPILPD